MNDSEGMKLTVSSEKGGGYKFSAENLLCTPAEIQPFPSQGSIELHAREYKHGVRLSEIHIGKEVQIIRLQYL